MTEEIIVKMLVCKHGLLSVLLSGHAKHLEQDTESAVLFYVCILLMYNGVTRKAKKE